MYIEHAGVSQNDIHQAILYSGTQQQTTLLVSTSQHTQTTRRGDAHAQIAPATRRRSVLANTVGEDDDDGHQRKLEQCERVLDGGRPPDREVVEEPQHHHGHEGPGRRGDGGRGVETRGLLVVVLGPDPGRRQRNRKSEPERAPDVAPQDIEGPSPTWDGLGTRATVSVR